MTPPEAAVLLGVCAAYDRRTVGEADAIAWAQALDDITLDEARAAVIQHYRESRDWIMPADVRTLVRRARELRLAARPIPEPAPELAADPRAYQQALRAAIKDIADGHAVGQALAIGRGAAPSSVYDQARGPYRAPHRQAAMRVPCPWDTCRAMPYEGCRTASGRLLDQPHEGRLVAAGLADWVEINGVPRAVLRGTEDPEAVT
ncbi:hypothetical protein [Thermoactinospora rubra]|uniref:zinc finger domain-containing protein n=1 Tax=Thermoactinospora rubra TaxID=1088767 RepID=UPI000A10B277|nr:hypothetical protein [Thermoactinospora rubra]